MGIENLGKLAGLFKAHPWHGLTIGDGAPEVVTTYIEIVPSDTIKYELDKTTGLLKVDRPQRYSNVSPALYGIIPQTQAGESVAALCRFRTGRPGIKGDMDPLDICVLTEKNVSHGDFFMKAIPIGGLRMIDRNEADEKLLAVMQGDNAFGHWRDIDDVPEALIARFKHYFLTYKLPPDSFTNTCEITGCFGREEAHEIIRRGQLDYERKFATLKEALEQLNDGLPG